VKHWALVTRTHRLLAVATAGLALVAGACGGGTSSPATSSISTQQAPAATSGTGTGNAAAGAKVFDDAGCGNCHALAAAGSHGGIGPDLDALKPDYGSVVAQVTVGGGGMPSFKSQLSAQQINDVAAYVVQSTQG